jgi:hypothetical protein
MAPRQPYTGVLRQVIESLTADRERTRRVITSLQADVLDRSHDVAVRMGTSADVAFEEVLDVEQTATLAAATSLLYAAHAASDPMLFAEAEVRTEAIGSMLDEIAEAQRAGEPERLQTLRREVGVAVGAFSELVAAA